MTISEAQLESETVTCNNCNITTLSSICNTKLVAQIVIQTIEDKKILKFTCFNDAISSFLKNNWLPDVIIWYPTRRLRENHVAGRE